MNEWDDEDRPSDWMTFLTKHCGLYIPGVYVSNPYNDSRPITATAIGWSVNTNTLVI